MNNKRVLIIGGGITGIKAAISLSKLKINSYVVEKKPEIGGKVSGYSKIFPDFRNGTALAAEFMHKIHQQGNIVILTHTTVLEIFKRDKQFHVKLSSDKGIEVDAIIIACGFSLFDPLNQMEYGYGVYKNVITSMELENMLNPSGPTGGELIRPHDGRPARRIAFIFCVGSRNVKIGNPYCSRICCSYSTKQAIEIKEKYADSSVTCFYMDIRTNARGFEEMYYNAQQLGVKYIRGRVSECSSLKDGDIQIRTENTLLQKPVQGIFDLVSLATGMIPFEDAHYIERVTGAKRGPDGFFQSADDYLLPFDSTVEGIFIAGTVTGLKPIKNCLQDGDGVAARVAQYIY